MRALRTLAVALTGILGASALAAPAVSAPPAGPHKPPRPAPAVAPPTMGWNDWNTFGCDVSAELVKQSADAMVASGLAAAGYTYVNIDDCWSTRTRGADGRLVPDPVKFPDGITPVADYVHSKGLKLGIYGDAGTKTCAGFPGSLGHEAVDAQTFAEWKVDLLKYDNCFNEGLPAPPRYQAMADALAATGRKIVYSICEWGVNDPWTWAPSMGAYWRIDGDITPVWESVRSIARQLMRVGNGWSGPGYHDPDMLMVGKGVLSPTEERSHFGLWALYGSPLILGNDVRDMPAESLSLVTNKAVIALDQQAAGHPVREVSSGHGTYVLAREMNDGSTVVAFYNETDTAAPMRTTTTKAGVSRARAHEVTDLWTGAKTSTTGVLEAQVPARGLSLMQIRPARYTKGAAPLITMDAPRLPGTQEFLVGPDGIDTTLSVTAPQQGGHLRNVAVRLTLPEGWTSATPATARADKVKAGTSKKWTWRVTPPKGATAPGIAKATVTWANGQRREVDLRLTPKPAAPTSATTVAAVPWVHAWAGYARPQRNRGIEGQALTVAGTTYATGIGTHGESEVAVWLGGRCTSMTTSFGLQDRDRGAVRGILRGDGRELARSGVKRNGEAADRLTVDLRGVNYLELHGDIGAGSSYGSRMVWGGTELNCS